MKKGDVGPAVEQHSKKKIIYASYFKSWSSKTFVVPCLKAISNGTNEMSLGYLLQFSNIKIGNSLSLKDTYCISEVEPKYLIQKGIRFF